MQKIIDRFVVLLFLTVFFMSLPLLWADDHQSVSKPTSLEEKIKAHAKKINEKPENAYIDRVWKKTPGRDGRQVNIKKSLEKMGDRFHKDKLVIDRIEPDIQLNDLGPSPIYRGHPKKEMVALMINVSWGEDYLDDILQVLKEEQVKASFFIEGQWAKKFPEYVQLILEEGHTIGNHAYDHPDMQTLSTQEIEDQIKETNAILKAITNKDPSLFAPPSGSFNDKVVNIAHNLQMETILWTVDTVDWNNPETNDMINNVIEKIHPGAMVLMHPTKPVAEGLEEMIRQIKEKQLKLGTVNDLLKSSR